MPLVGKGIEAAQAFEDVGHSREQYGDEARHRAEKKGRRDDMRENLRKVIGRGRFYRHVLAAPYRFDKPGWRSAIYWTLLSAKRPRILSFRASSTGAGRGGPGRAVNLLGVERQDGSGGLVLAMTPVKERRTSQS